MEQFHLWRNEFQGSEGIEFALEIMQSQKKILGCSYDRNPVDNGLDCQRLVDAIVSHPNISTVYLKGLCGREINGHDYLVNLLSKDEMERVDFTDCGVNTDGQSTLFDVIKLHRNLVWLCLDDNKLNDMDAIHLADALRHNRTLKTLQLCWGNKFTRSGKDALKKAVYDDSSLNAVADSNHVCTINGLGFTHYYNNFILSCEDEKKEQKLLRAGKIFLLLRERNKQGTNVYHLEAEMGQTMLKVVPLALAAVQIYGGQRGDAWKAADAAELSIMYELLRSWHGAGIV